MVAAEYLSGFLQASIMRENFDYDYINELCFREVYRRQQYRTLNRPGYLFPGEDYGLETIWDDLFTEVVELVVEIEDDVNEALSAFNSISFKRTSNLVFSTPKVIVIKTRFI